MKPDTKTVYAQSSDIKSRTYLEYRKDMKQKAIAELEILPWLKDEIRKKDKKARVEKFGGDKFIWFLRKGGITREPDFIIKYSNKKTKYVEFQYAKEELKAYDFKISKIAPKDRKLKKRVPKEKFKKVLQKDKKLNAVCDLIDKKVTILDFQHEAIEKEKEKFSHLLQQVLDEEKVLKIMPKTLDGFFKVCFTLNHLEKTPVNASLWLIYLLSFLSQKLNSYKIFQLVYSLDFLYSQVDLKKNEINKLAEGIKSLHKKLKQFSKPDGSFQSSKAIAPLEDTRYSLFAINILEDLTQDILFYYDGNFNLKPVSRIYQTISQIDKTFRFIIK